MPSSLLRTEHLSRAVGDKVVVDDISIEVGEGEVLAILGRSGAGKSSFVRLINRLDEPTAGTVFLDGIDYRTQLPREVRRHVGMVMQSAFLFPGTIADNLRFGPRQRGVELSDAAIDELLRDVGLSGFAARDVLNLSGGEAQRVSLARTLANQPRVLLLDEPTSALDVVAEREIETLLLQIQSRRSLTMLMITHDAAQAERIAHRAIVLRRGRLICDGDIQEALRAESAVS